MVSARIGLLGIAAGACSLAACGNSSDGGSSDDAGVHPDASAGDATPGSDASTDAGAEVGADGDGGVTPLLLGTVFVQNLPDQDSGQPIAIASASFYPGPLPVSPCPLLVGMCTDSTTCTQPVNTGPFVSAGTLTMTGGAFSDAGTVIPMNGGGTYTYTSKTFLFAPGDMLTAAASGGVFPAFGPFTIQAPPTITITSPASSAGVYTIPTSGDLTVQWSGGVTGGLLALQLFGTPPDGGLAGIGCLFDGAAGHGVIPGSMLLTLRGATQGAVDYVQTAESILDAGSVSLAFQVGQEFQATVVYQ
jgi:hypothetical protein